MVRMQKRTLILLIPSILMIITSVMLTIGGIIAIDLLRKEIPEYLGSVLYAGLLIFGVSGGLIFYTIWNLRAKKPTKIRTPIFYVIAFLLFGGAVFVYQLAFTELISIAPASMATQFQWNQGPWLSLGTDTQTEMNIRWETNETAPTVLKYGMNVTVTQQVLNTAGRKHLIHLKNLEPGTSYFYQIQNFTDSAWHNFTTAPATPIAFTFLVLGDNRNSGGLDDSVNTKHNEVVGAMLAQEHQLTLNVGDVNYDGNDLDSWHVFLKEMERDAADHPYMVAVGNHEMGGDGGRNYDYVFEYDYADPNPSFFAQGRYYSFNYSNAHFLMIDTNSLGEVSQSQLAFIEADLARNQGQNWIFAFFHEPPLSTGDYNMDWGHMTAFCPLFDKYGVDAVFTGHDHHYESFNWTYGANGLTFSPNHDWEHNDVMYFVTGGGGSNLDMGITTRSPKTYTRCWYNNTAGAYITIEEHSNPWLTNQTSPEGNYYHNSSEHAVQTELLGQIYGELAYQYMRVRVNGSTVTIESFYRDNSLMPGQNFTLTNTFSQVDDGRRLYDPKGDLYFMIGLYSMAIGFNALFLFGLLGLDFILRKKLKPTQQ